MACRRGLLLLLPLLARPVDAQIKLMRPLSLVETYKETGGWIIGSTATFGAPFYGDRLIGRLVYGASKKGQAHCSVEDYDMPARIPPPNGQRASRRLLHIVIVRRGGCSFTTKARIAQEKGADAVIIVDKEDSTLTRKDMANIIVADDGFGGSIKIPSILIAKEDGNVLIRSLENLKQDVIVELAWNLPTNHIVKVDLWMSSASSVSMQFLKAFAPMRKRLNSVVEFQPHYAIFGMPAPNSQLCSDSTGAYCAEDPDGSGPITGAEVIAEDVRQLCIHEVTKVRRTSANSVKAGYMFGILFAAKFWEYIEQFQDNCPLDGQDAMNRFGSVCSTKLMKLVGIDTDQVEACVQANTTAYLKREREFQAWSPRALRINGWRYSGVLDAELASKAICSGFVETPIECKVLEMIEEEPSLDGIGVPAGGFGVKDGLLLLGGVAILLALVMNFYKRFLKKEMRGAMREEVMLEVQAAIGEYQKMQETS